MIGLKEHGEISACNDLCSMLCIVLLLSILRGNVSSTSNWLSFKQPSNLTGPQSYRYMYVLTHSGNEGFVELVSKQGVWETTEEQFERACDIMDRVHLWVNNHTPSICTCIVDVHVCGMC